MSCASDNCDEHFKPESNVFDHTKVYSTSEPYACDECTLSFKTNADLKNHKIYIHSTSRPYTCDKCKKSFKTKVVLKQHMVVHSTSRPYVCDECTMSFTRNADLKSHKLHIHSTLKPYTCDDCKKSFKTKIKLKMHMTIHSTSRPYVCDTCKKSFKQGRYLAVHKRNVHSSRLYACDECKKSFKHKRNLMMHKNVHSTLEPHGDGKCEPHEPESQSKNVIDHYSGHHNSGESNPKKLSVYDSNTNENGNSIIIANDEDLLSISCMQNQHADETNRQCYKNNVESELLLNDVDEILRQLDTDKQAEIKLLDEYIFFSQNLSFLE